MDTHVTLDNNNVGPHEIIINTANAALTGAKAPNYTLKAEDLTVTVKITRADITDGSDSVTIKDGTGGEDAILRADGRRLSKVYDGAPLTLTADDITVPDALAGDGYTVTFNGEESAEIMDAGTITVNVTVSSQSYNDVTVEFTLEVTAKTLSVAVTPTDRVYEAGNVNVDVNYSDLTGVVDGDEMALSANRPTSGAMENDSVGRNKPVTIEAPEGGWLTGEDAGNYTVMVIVGDVNIFANNPSAGGTGGGTTPANPEEPVTDIPEGDVPLTDIPEGGVPLTDIPEGGVPLSDAPQTGDNSQIWEFLAIISGAGLAWLVPKNKKREDTAE